VGGDILRACKRDGVHIVVFWVETYSGPAREMVFILWCCGWRHPHGLPERWCSYFDVVGGDILRACTRDGVHIVVLWVERHSQGLHERWCLYCDVRVETLSGSDSTREKRRLERKVYKFFYILYVN
jgi:hypothetical protein